MNTLSRRLTRDSHLTPSPSETSATILLPNMSPRALCNQGALGLLPESGRKPAVQGMQGLIWSGLGVLKWDIWGWATYPKPSFKSMKGKKWEQFHHKFNTLLPGSAFFSPIFLTRSLGWLAVIQTSICQRSEVKVSESNPEKTTQMVTSPSQGLSLTDPAVFCSFAFSIKNTRKPENRTRQQMGH